MEKEVCSNYECISSHILMKKNKISKFYKILKTTSEIIVVLAVIFIGVLIYAFTVTPSVADLATKTATPQTTIIYDRTGQHVLYEIHGEENRKVIDSSQIPNSIKEATIATEDSNFYKHGALDFESIIRAALVDIENRRILQGGSTITQQLARNVFLNRDKSFQRKITEAILALKLEQNYSKNQILDMYLNQIPYGSNAYGIEAAAETFFGKPAKELTLDEAALLAALPQAPTYYSPYGKNLDALRARQVMILNRIATLGLASPQTVAAAEKVNTLKKIAPLQQKIDAPHFVFYVKDWLEKKYGKQAVEEGGLKVYTTLDYNKQTLAEQTLTSSEKLLTSYGASNAALVAIDPKTGQILAMVGSVDYNNQQIDGQVNVCTSPRQPGSSFKPFVYAKAFEDGYQPESLLLDERTDFGPGGANGGDYIPKDYDDSYRGVVTMREALGSSLNIPAVETLTLVGVNNAIEMAHRLGITTLNDPSKYGLALVLGGGDVTLLDETAGYSVFANDGRRNPVTPILKIVDANGKVLENSEPQNIPVLDPQIARKINSVLSDNSARTPIFGPSSPLHISGKTVAAKTGTTQYYNDAWTVGYTPSIAVGVWAGNDNDAPMHYGADGVFVAAPIWNKFISQVINEYPPVTFMPYNKTNSQITTRYVQSTNFKTTVTTYYKKEKHGKKVRISKEEAQRLDPDKVIIKNKSVDNPTVGSPGNNLSSNNTDSDKLR